MAQLWSTSGQSGQPAPFSPHGSFHQTLCVELIGPTTIFPLCAPCIYLQHFCLHTMTQCGAKFAQAHRPYDTGTKERTATSSGTANPTSVCARLPDVPRSFCHPGCQQATPRSFADCHLELEAQHEWHGNHCSAMSSDTNLAMTQCCGRLI